MPNPTPMNKELPEWLKKQIEKQAAESSNRQEFNYPDDNWSTDEVADQQHRMGFEVGAEHYASLYLESERRLKIAMDAFAEIVENLEGFVVESDIKEARHLARKTIAQLKEGGKNG